MTMWEIIEKIEILLKGITYMAEFDLKHTNDKEKKIIFQTRLNLAKDILEFIKIQKRS